MSRLHVRRSYLYHHVYGPKYDVVEPWVRLKEEQAKAVTLGRKNLFLHAHDQRLLWSGTYSPDTGWAGAWEKEDRE